VVGLITERYGDSWTVDIRSPFTAKLDALAFEGVTRRSRPNLHPGDLVYARVTAAPRDTDPEIVCTVESGQVSSTPARVRILATIMQYC
jgi:exosome complex component RRP40